MKKLGLLALAALGLSVVVGCGGGGSSCGGYSSRNGSLNASDDIYAFSDRNRYADIWDVTACGDGTLTLTLNSTDMDPYVMIAQRTAPGTYLILARNDDSGGGLNSRLTYSASRGTTYSIICTSFSGGYGSYNLGIDGPVGGPSQQRPAQAGPSSPARIRLLNPDGTPMTSLPAKGSEPRPTAVVETSPTCKP